MLSTGKDEENCAQRVTSRGGGGEACTALANSGGEGLRHEGKKLGLRESINPELMELRVL